MTRRGSAAPPATGDNTPLANSPAVKVSCPHIQIYLFDGSGFLGSSGCMCGVFSRISAIWAIPTHLGVGKSASWRLTEKSTEKKLKNKFSENNAAGQDIVNLFRSLLDGPIVQGPNRIKRKSFLPVSNSSLSSLFLSLWFLALLQLSFISTTLLHSVYFSSVFLGLLCSLVCFQLTILDEFQLFL